MRNKFATAGAGSSILLYLIGLGFFYIKYVPLVTAFQIFLIPILVATTILTAKDDKNGLLFFVFAFPLINNLPYFLGISEPYPHAPTALVLFLFYFLGWLIHRFFIKAGERMAVPLRRSLILTSLLVVLSAAVTFFRYANFFPFQGGGLYDLVVNTQGVTAGGAFMSIVFTSLNYLGGFAFFIAFIDTVKSSGLRRKILTVLGTSVLLSLAFGLVQRFHDIRLGNNPLSIESGMINATFKDALSFGCFLSMAVPLFLGVAVGFRGAGRRILVCLVVGLSFYLILFSGSKSSLAGLGAALLFFLIMAARRLFRQRKILPADRRKFRLWRAAAGAILLLTVAGLVTLHKPFLREIKSSRTIERFEKAQYMLNLRRQTLWKTAWYCTADYPFTGVGLGAFIIECSNYAALHGFDIGAQSAENLLLQMMSELGAAGLLLFLWIFGAIARRIRTTFKHGAEGASGSWLLIGATSGLLAYAVNVQFHSYIGSYEITYAFWLLVSLVFSMGDAAEESRGDQTGRSMRGPSRHFKIFAVAFLAFFSAVNLWNSLHSLSLFERMRNFGIIQEFGFYRLEHTDDGEEFRWTRRCAGMPLQIVNPVLVIPLHCSHPDIEENPVCLRIYWTSDFFKHRKLLKKIIFSRNDWQKVILALPDEVGRDGILFIKVSRTWNPLKTTGARDPRNLGVAVSRIAFRDF